jgi:hypothetical protein
MKKNIFLSVFLLITTLSWSQEHLKHEKWTNLLEKHVDESGNVDYKGFKEDESQLDAYLKVLSNNHPQTSWKKNDQLAFWINAYNAFTVKLIVKHYPVKTIKELGGSIYKINTPWDIKFIKIGEETYDLNNIEHGIIRKEFNEPRIHFAVNCASISCPKLRNEAYVGSKLDSQLDDQAKSFINNPSKNNIKKKTAQLSKLFRWFKGDFENGKTTVIDFINKYAETKITKKTKIDYLEYDWNLNEK